MSDGPTRLGKKIKYEPLVLNGPPDPEGGCCVTLSALNISRLVPKVIPGCDLLGFELAIRIPSTPAPSNTPLAEVNSFDQVEFEKYAAFLRDLRSIAKRKRAKVAELVGLEGKASLTVLRVSGETCVRGSVGHPNLEWIRSDASLIYGEMENLRSNCLVRLDFIFKLASEVLAFVDTDLDRILSALNIGSSQE